MRANVDDQQQIESGTADDVSTSASVATQLAGREPYTPPVIEKFPPMGNVTFGTSVQPMLAMSLSGA